MSLDNINKLIEDAIDSSIYYSPYYPTPYSIIYFISRSYTGKKIPKIIDFLLSQRDADYKWNNPLDTALVISSLINFKARVNNLKNSIDYLLQKQNSSWDAHPFYAGINPSGKADGTKYYAGCASLTTAFCLEALNKYNELKSKKVTKQNTKTQNNSIQAEVREQAEQNFCSLGSDINKLFKLRLKRAIKTDKEQPIILLPYLFLLMLGNEEKEDSIVTKLGLANLYGWIAYAIYDDFLDNEGDAKLLPLANICLRELTIIFNNTLPLNLEFRSFFKQTMDEIDSANSWEVNNCRLKIKNKKLDLKNFDFNKTIYKNLDKLAERSMGHALGPIAILFNLGYKKDSDEIKNLILFFKHYIIARQLNDDAHDWEQDLKNGHITPVVEILLKQFGKSIDLKKNLQELQSMFWHETILDICDKILKNVETSRKALSNILIIKDNAPFEKFLTKVERAATDALYEREKTLKFLRAYEEKSKCKKL